jgi:hypothetical protein
MNSVSEPQHCDENIAGKKFIKGNHASHPDRRESHELLPTFVHSIEKPRFWESGG